MKKGIARQAGALMVAGMLTVGLGACGSDDEESTGSDATGGSAESVAADGADFCDAAVAVDAANLGFASGESSQEDLDAAFEAAVTAAPDGIVDAVQTMVTESQAAAAEAPEGEDPPPIPGDEFFKASAQVGGYLSDDCGFETLDVTATEYAFEGIPDSVTAGTTLMTFDNQGDEFHEVILMQFAEGEDRTVEELLALPDEEAEALVTSKAFVSGPPGTASYTTAELDPGRYVAICFVPVGATPEAMASGAEPEGDAHFMQGMVTEFEVA